MLNHTSDSIGNRRSACDRCRRHKLRCEKGGTGRCHRCEKAHAQCVMGPALRSGRPTQISNSPLLPVLSVPGEHASLSLAANITPDVSFRPLGTPPEVPSYATGLEAQPLLSPANIDEFNDIWSHPFASAEMTGASNERLPTTPTFAPPNETMKKLADLQTNILSDLETVKYCRTADKCPEVVDATYSITAQNVMVGRMLDHSTTLIGILDHFQPNCTNADYFNLSCDMPILMTLVSCYVSLVRIYRTIFSCIVDSLPFLLGIQHPAPQLFPGMHLGGFKLEARVDLQVQILVKISEDMLRSIETRFGLSDDAPEAGAKIPQPGKAAQLLRMMLEEEALEQPEIHEPRGDCKPLKELLAGLRDSDRKGRVR